MVESVKHFHYYLEGRKFTACTDHKPLICARSLSQEKAPPRRLRQFMYLAQFEITYEYLPGKSNDVADALSRVEVPESGSTEATRREQALSVHSIDFPARFDVRRLQSAQNSDSDLPGILDDPAHPLKLSKIPFGPEKVEIYCERRENVTRPYVPAQLRDGIFSLLHSLSHDSTRAMKRWIKQHFVWPNIDKDIASRCRNCLDCQRAKVSRHTKPVPLRFDTPDARFDHVHIDIVGPLPNCGGYRYLLTMMDRYIRWPEAVPLLDTKAVTIARAFYRCWVARFGAPLILTSDQGGQFEGGVFSKLLQVCGVRRCRTTAYHPSGNGLIERRHRSLKAAFMCYSNAENWLEVLPSVLLGLRTRLISGADCSPAEMLYGGPLRIPGDLCFDEETKVDPKIFKSELRAHMSKVKPVLVDHKRKQKGFVADDLSTCSYVFKLDKRITTALVPPYTGPHRVLDRNDKFHTITIDDHGRESVVSIERLKPAHFIVATDAHAASSYSVAAAEAVNTSVRASSSERPVAPVRVRGARNTRRGRRK
ncbi:hypothetical protein TKK_0011357 [Trichogramma kaykai]